MGSSRLLSIVIPTRNRQEYCVAAVEQILTLNLNDVEVVIQDNSDDESLRSRLEHYISSGRVIYHYRQGIISFVDNFSEAISLSCGEYVCMIGDDDGILPNILKITQSAKERDIDCVIAGLNAVYIWPSPTPIRQKYKNGYLCVSYLKDKEEYVDCKKALEMLALQGGQEYQSLNLPRVYHGIAKRSKLDEVKAIAGNYFMGLTPDIFIAVALGSVCEKVVRLSYPISISGICPRSGSSDSATGRHTGELKDAPHFRGHENYKWDVKAPSIYSVESIWAETALQAYKIFGNEKLYNEFNVQYLDNLCLEKYPQFSEIIKVHAGSLGVKIIKPRGTIVIRKVKSLIERVLKRIVNLGNGVYKYYNIQNLQQAVVVVCKYLK